MPNVDALSGFHFTAASTIIASVFRFLVAAFVLWRCHNCGINSGMCRGPDKVLSLVAKDTSMSRIRPMRKAVLTMRKHALDVVDGHPQRQSRIIVHEGK